MLMLLIRLFAILVRCSIHINLKYILRKLRSSETRGVHSNIKKTSGGTRSQKGLEPLQ